MSVQISASILSADFSKLGNEITLLNDAGVDYIHIDVMDGNFVPNITFGPVVISSIRKYTQIPFDVHLMIKSPFDYLEDFIKSGGDIITIHAEATVHLDRAVQKIKSLGKKAGVSIIPTTHPNSIEYLMHELDIILIMSVNPGFSGQQFIPSQLKKISYLRDQINNQSLKTKIAVDGGVNLQNASSIITAGADILVMGSTVFNSNNIVKNVMKIRKILHP